jgi:hypothetical protein
MFLLNTTSITTYISTFIIIHWCNKNVDIKSRAHVLLPKHLTKFWGTSCRYLHVHYYLGRTLIPSWFHYYLGRTHSLMVSSDQYSVYRCWHGLNWLPRYNWNIVESGVKHHNSTLTLCVPESHLDIWLPQWFSTPYRTLESSTKQHGQISAHLIINSC